MNPRRRRARLLILDSVKYIDVYGGHLSAANDVVHVAIRTRWMWAAVYDNVFSIYCETLVMHAAIAVYRRRRVPVIHYYGTKLNIYKSLRHIRANKHEV